MSWRVVAVVLALGFCSPFALPGRGGGRSSLVGTGRCMLSTKDAGVDAGLEGCSVGIDLGTTYSLVSVVQGGVPRIIPIDGASTLPSIVAYLKDGTCIVGEAARRQEVLNPTNSFSSTKRIIGKTRKEMKKFDEKCFVSKLSARDEAPADGSSEKAFVQLSCPALGSDASISPDGISALILKRLIDQADAFLYSEADASASVRLDTPSRVKRAVITVPAYFTQQQRDATERAGKLAGLEKVKLLREPEAAALAYGLNLHKQQLVLVFDLGGGTFDVSVLAVGGGFVEVIATNGDSHLGGDDFDYVVVDWLLEQLAAVTSKEAAGRVAKDVFALARLREAALQAKKALSQEREVAIDVPFICGEVGLSVTLTRKKFEALSKKLFLRMLKPLREVAIMAGVNLPGESGELGFDAREEDEEEEEEYRGAEGLDISNIDQASASELRRVQQEGRRAARDKKKRKSSATKEMRRLQKALSDPKLLAFPGGQVLDEVLLVGGATRISAVRRLVRAVTGVEPQRSVNPDEAVCLGAGTMAGILDGSIADMQVMSAWQAAVLQAINEQRKKGNYLPGIVKKPTSPITDASAEEEEEEEEEEEGADAEEEEEGAEAEEVEAEGAEDAGAQKAPARSASSIFKAMKEKRLRQGRRQPSA